MTLLFAILLLLADGSQAVTHTLGCNRYPEVCNLRCYAIFSAGLPAVVTWNAPTQQQKDNNRRACGTVPNPCCSGAIARPAECVDLDGNIVPCNSPDEYPYAASVEGGAGSIVRCTSQAGNLQEGRDWATWISLNEGDGGCGRVAPCRINIAFSFLGPDTPLCNARGSPNDGFEHIFRNNAWQLAKRDNGNVTWERHSPDPGLFIPLHERREFLLDNGERVLVGSTDPSIDWFNEVFQTGNATARAVKELLGDEKSVAFRPTSIVKKWNVFGHHGMHHGMSDVADPLQSLAANIAGGWKSIAANIGHGWTWTANHGGSTWQTRYTSVRCNTAHGAASAKDSSVIDYSTNSIASTHAYSASPSSVHTDGPASTTQSSSPIVTTISSNSGATSQDASIPTSIRSGLEASISDGNGASALSMSPVSVTAEDSSSLPIPSGNTLELSSATDSTRSSATGAVASTSAINSAAPSSTPSMLISTSTALSSGASEGGSTLNASGSADSTPAAATSSSPGNAAIPGSGSTTTLPSTDTRSVFTVIIDPFIYGEPSPSISCIPPCTFILPSITLSTATTLTHPAVTVTLEVDGQGSDGRISSLSTTVETITFPQITTSVISVGSIVYNDTAANTVTVDSSIVFPPITLTQSGTGSSSTTPVFITYTPGPISVLRPSSTSSGDPGIIPPITISSGSPPGPTCTANCGSPCSVNCTPEPSCVGICGTIGPQCTTGCCVGACGGGGGGTGGGGPRPTPSEAPSPSQTVSPSITSAPTSSCSVRTVTDYWVSCSYAPDSTTCITTSSNVITECAASGITTTTFVSYYCPNIIDDPEDNDLGPAVSTIPPLSSSTASPPLSVLSNTASLSSITTTSQVLSTSTTTNAISSARAIPSTLSVGSTTITSLSASLITSKPATSFIPCKTANADPDQGINSGYCVCSGNTLSIKTSGSVSCAYTAVPTDIITPTVQSTVITYTDICSVCTKIGGGGGSETCTSEAGCTPASTSTAIPAQPTTKPTFLVFYQVVSGAFIDADTEFYFFRNPPNCDDFGNTRAGAGNLNDGEQSYDMNCETFSGITCYPRGDGRDGSGIKSLTWCDGGPNCGNSQLLTCGLGEGAQIVATGDGVTYDLQKANGEKHGKCYIPTNPQDIDCPFTQIRVGGKQTFACYSDDCQSRNDVN